MKFDNNFLFNIQNQKIIADFYKKEVQHILNIWWEHTMDYECGGYITDFDRKWNIRSMKKGAWAQGRQIYTFASAQELFNHQTHWLELAESGKNFVKQRMYAGNGRFYYLLDQSGKEVLEGTISIFSDAFIIGGIAKYITVSKNNNQEELVYLNKIFECFAENIMNEDFTNVAPFVSNKEVCCHALYMIGLNTSYEVFQATQSERAWELMGFCLKQILFCLYDEKTQLILERKKRNGQRDHDEDALLVNTGHIFESLWFCLEAILLGVGENEYINKIQLIAERNYKCSRGVDGNSIYAYHAEGKEIDFKTWKYEINFNTSDKVSWSYVEELYLWALLAKVTNDNIYFQRFIQIHNFIQEHFVDRTYGDWFHALNVQNEIIYDFKGSTIKCAYHMPRAMMRIVKLFSE